MRQRTRLLLASAIVVVAIGYLMYTGFSSGAVAYFRVEELLAQNSDLSPGQEVKVSGMIVKDSVQWDPVKIRLAFSIEGESGGVLPVVYDGIKPDIFEAGIEAVVQGTLTSDGVLEARQVLTRCPSKYEPEGGEGTTPEKT